MATCLQQLAAAWALDLKVECVDIKRSATRHGTLQDPRMVGLPDPPRMVWLPRTPS